MNCLNCNKPLTKSYQKKFCSNECKLDPKYFDSRIAGKARMGINEDNKIAICNLDGWQTTDYNNLAGSLRKHLIKLGISVTKSSDLMSYYKIETIASKPTIKCPACSFTTNDISNKSGTLTKHIVNVHKTTTSDFISEYPDIEPILYHQGNVSKYKKSLLDPENQVVCLECNTTLMKITETHMKLHGISVAQYKEKHPTAKIVSDYLSSELSKRTSKRNLVSGFKRRSRAELFLEQWFLERGCEVITADRSLGFEIDLMLPQFKLGIEFDGLLYHSEDYGKKGRSYHSQKTRLANEKDIHLIHIMEDEWELHRDLVIKKLELLIHQSTQSKVYARKCEVKKVTTEVKNEFLQNNHLQGQDKSQVSLGLFHESDLVAIATFGSLRRALGQSRVIGEFELVRYSTTQHVIGGLGKLLKHFIKIYNPDKIVSFADKRFTNKHSNLYIACGFNLVSESAPNYWYMKNYKKRLHRYNFTKGRIVEKLGGLPELSEWENMKLLGYDRIWDCGNLKYELKIN